MVLAPPELRAAVGRLDTTPAVLFDLGVDRDIAATNGPSVKAERPG